MPKKIKIAIASDHAGFELKEFLKTSLINIQWLDLGPKSKDRVDYPDFAGLAAASINAKQTQVAVLVCGSGIGMSIAANKFKGIRAAVVESEVAARLSKMHNNSNVLCLGSRILAAEYAKEIVNAWLNAKFEGGRHQDRIVKISKLEGKTNDKTRLLPKQKRSS